MVSVSVKIDPKSFEEFQRAVEEFAKGINADTHDVAIHQAHLICQDAMKFTPPMMKTGGGGLSNDALDMGKGAVKADINSISISANNRSAAFLMYRSLATGVYQNDRGRFDRVLAGSKKVLQNTTNPIMRKIAMDPDHERAFKKARNLFAKAVPQLNSDNVFDKHYDDIRVPHEKAKVRYNGRNIRKKQKTGWLNKYITTEQSVIENEIKRSYLQIGALKAGWFKAKKLLPKMKGRNVKNPGSDYVGQWIRRHAAPNGVSNYSYNERTLNLSIINLIGNNNNVATVADTKNIVYGNRVKQMPAEMQKVFLYQVDKFNKKTKK